MEVAIPARAASASGLSLLGESEDAMSYTIEVRGLEELQAKLGIPLRVVLAPAWLALGQQLKGYISQYPGPVTYPLRWPSAAHRRAYFAHRRGNLPYVRGTDYESQRLGASWAVESDDFGVVVGTRVTYAPQVQSDERQWAMHAATGWKTDKQAAEELEASGSIPRIIENTILAAYN